MSPLVLLACVHPPGAPADPTPTTVDTDTTVDTTADTDTTDTYTGPPSTELCTESDAFVAQYAATIARWVAQDTLAPGPEDPLVFVGGSSVRRWEGLARAWTDYRPIQRGFGGAQLGEVAKYADDLVLRHHPRGVVVYAGTNDVDAGVDPAVVVERLRCVRARVAEGAPGAPVFFVGITPNPARWDQWAAAEAVNSAVAALAADDAGLVYVDVPAAFLATGSPPDASLFVADGLHLSDAGYTLWNSVIRAAVEPVLAPSPPQPFTPLTTGTRVLVDLGPTDGINGERSGAPDWLGQAWNDWHDTNGGDTVLPGEHLGPLVTTDGAPTPLELVITGGFGANGRQNGGLLWPDPALLGDLAVGTATEDYLYAMSDDATGGLQLRGLDPSSRYTLRFFGTRDEVETRITRYTVYGAATAEATLQTSGAGAGVGNANDDDVATFTGVAPDAWGNVFVDVAIAEGTYGYVGIVALTAE